MSMDAEKWLDWQVKEKCGNRIVKVILERIQIQVSGSKKSVNKSHKACSSPKIILKNQNVRLWDVRQQSRESSPGGNRPQRNRTKNYKQYFEAGSTGSDNDDESNFGADTLTSELGPRDTSDAESESAFSSNTERIIKNLKTTSTNLDLDLGNKIYQNNDHSSTAKKLKAAISYPKVACSICNLIISKGHMGRHFKTQHPENNLQCDLCPYKCTTQRWLQHHILEVHVVDKPFECGICLKSFMTKEVLRKHKRSHGDKYLNCDLCPAKCFKDSACLNKHLQVVHRRYNYHCDSDASCNNHLCPVCDTWFLTDADFAHHLKIPKNKSMMKCDMCSKPVYTPCRLNLHRQNTHNKNPNAETCIKRAQLETMPKSPTAKQNTQSEKKTEISASVKILVSSNTFSCIVCSAIFTRWSDLELHELQTKHRRWKCSICSKLFTRREYLKRHIRVIHSDARPFRCTYKGCSKSFKEMRVLKKHLIMHDADKYRFKCDICSKMFASRQTLKQHLLTHTDERPWPCKFCGKMFKCSREATRHMKKCQVSSAKKRKKIGTQSNGTLQGAQKRKRKKIISCSSIKSTRESVKWDTTLPPEPKATSTNALTCATTNCNENGTNLKLIKQEKDIKYYGDDSIIYQVPRPEENVVRFEMVPKQEMCSDSSD